MAQIPFIQLAQAGSIPLDTSIVLTGTYGATVFTYKSEVGRLPTALGYGVQHHRSTVGPALRPGELPDWVMPHRAFAYISRITTIGTVPVLNSVNVRSVRRLVNGDYQVNFLNTFQAADVFDDTGSSYRAPYTVMCDVYSSGTRGDFSMRSAGRGVGLITKSNGSNKLNTGFRINLGSIGSNGQGYTDNDFAYAYLYAYGSNFFRSS